jgi:hypothetical protein
MKSIVVISLALFTVFRESVSQSNLRSSTHCTKSCTVPYCTVLDDNVRSFVSSYSTVLQRYFAPDKFLWHALLLASSSSFSVISNSAFTVPPSSSLYFYLQSCRSTASKHKHKHTHSYPTHRKVIGCSSTKPVRPSNA